MRFVDEVVISVKGGKGGRGCVSFRREKFVPKGGPDGGDGGQGGSVILFGDNHLQTLADYLYRRRYRAKDGEHGKGKNCKGKDGEDILLPVPLGTDVYDALTNEKLGEVLKPAQQLVVAKGGKGGRGNTHFATPTNQAPRYSEPGEEGEERTLKLILRLIADIGFLGLPNAGKSTLLRALTGAKPKIADYPFTTLTPNLGVLKTKDVQITVADMPGIISGAHQGKGLGLKFLRHIERTRMLIYVVDITTHQPERDYLQLRKEVMLYNPELLKRPAILVLNKIDLLQEKPPELSVDIPNVLVSALYGTGIAKLKEIIEKTLSHGDE
ncbi:MAG: GTPase ObgE [candidate division WOR-3 bacterium]